VSDRNRIIADQEFWTRLEFEATGWLAASDDSATKQFWIDGFIPDTAENTKRGIDVRGIAWVDDGARSQHPFQFVVSVPQKMLSKKNPRIEIESLRLEPGEKTLIILLSSA
jgi:hypothetical protein